MCYRTDDEQGSKHWEPDLHMFLTSGKLVEGLLDVGETVIETVLDVGETVPDVGETDIETVLDVVETVSELCDRGGGGKVVQALGDLRQLGVEGSEAGHRPDIGKVCRFIRERRVRSRHVGVVGLGHDDFKYAGEGALQSEPPIRAIYIYQTEHSPFVFLNTSQQNHVMTSGFIVNLT